MDLVQRARNGLSQCKPGSAEEVREHLGVLPKVPGLQSTVYLRQAIYRVHSRSGTSSNYGKFERQGSESNDGRRYPGNVLFVPTVSGGIHPTQKPVELCEYLIRTYTRPGELVADICVGSGTTAIAAINTERRFVCFETAPSFYAAASERIRAAQAVKSSGEKGV